MCIKFLILIKLKLFISYIFKISVNNIVIIFCLGLLLRFLTREEGNIQLRP